MNNFTNEYRAWMISQINSTLDHPLVDTDKMSTEYLENMFKFDLFK